MIRQYAGANSMSVRVELELGSEFSSYRVGISDEALFSRQPVSTMFENCFKPISLRRGREEHRGATVFE